MLQFRLGLGMALCLGLMITGCSSKNPHAPGSVSGKVTYKGGPVPAGGIAFHIEGKGTYGIGLASDGSYNISDVPVGPAVVTIETESLNPKRKVIEYGGGKGGKMYQERLAKEGQAAAAKTAKGEYKQIPSKYADPKSSPLKVTLEAGSQTHNFELKD